ncbi:hypothetical protein GGR54DRAFT_644818 [Hypoxylon sp. NC1633]|nr:hypothetical protein GGR54DRAFT_644818 [Hypoxylon sp. NC1633]
MSQTSEQECNRPLEVSRDPEIFQKEVAHAPDHSIPTLKSAPAAMICGLRRKTFFIILGLAAVAIIALIGGPAGGLASKDQGESRTTTDSSNQDPSSSLPPLSNSTSAKLILNDSKDAYNSIIAQHWDSLAKSWTTDNLTDLVAATTTPLNPKPGTPLASASIDDPVFETHVCWVNDTLNGAILETWPGGQLAAMWQHCFEPVINCNGHWIVAYQRPEGAIKTANSST